MSDIDYMLPNGKMVDEICAYCRAGSHALCTNWFANYPDGDLADCCCEQTYSATQHQLAILKAQYGAEREAGVTVEVTKKPVDDTPRNPNGQRKGNSGYIHPDAWRSTKDLGQLTDPQSTGRKRAKEMYPIPQGQMCEWAGLENAGGGVVPIVGCIGYPASEIHHGPDKNTLNNAKASRGIGDLENIHWVCSMCHNEWHAKNDPFYPKVDGVERDYVRDQALPFVPQDPTLEIHAHDADTRAEHPRVYDEIPKGRVGKVGEVDEDWTEDDDE